MLSLTMRNEFICVLLLFSRGLMFSVDKKWTFLPQLQELCPFSSFCEENATLSLPENDTGIQCCESCSCKPGCEVYGNCCFDPESSSKTEILRKCTSPVVSPTKIQTTSYIMIYSCLKSLDQPDYSNSTMCSVNDTDYKSFAPVMSRKTGEIYVNSECAYCNKVDDIIPWKIAVKCPRGKDDHSFDTLKLLHGDDTGQMGCILTYVPPQNTVMDSRECLADVIRECNVTGEVMKWEPLWDYCPMFNAPYPQTVDKFYGNIFCLLCNTYISSPNEIRKTCTDGDQKHQLSSPLTVLLDGFNFAELDSSTSNHSKDECSPTEALVQSFKTECRPVVCPRGQFRLGGKCGFYSKEWIGGPFTAVLKLTPLAGTRKINRTLLTDLQPEIKYSKKARWLNRNAMKEWNVETLYRPSADGKYVEYLVAIASYPSTTVNPSRLWAILRRTLKDTWLLNVMKNKFRLQVQFNEYINEFYKKAHKSVLLREGLTIDEKYGYVNTEFDINDQKDRFLLEMHYPGHDIDTTKASVFLNEVFLCDQIELHPDEYEFSNSRLLFKVTNKTLHQTEYRLTETGEVCVCLNRFPQNKGVNMVNHYRILFVALSWICLTITNGYI